MDWVMGNARWFGKCMIVVVKGMELWVMLNALGNG